MPRRPIERLARDRVRGPMPDEPTRVVCPGCGRSLPVEETWRLVECPFCRTIVTRMDGDARFD
jgi:predicted RNA-binding Zn-ribbon protein involved in translation (DUF1610 family)